MIEILHISDPHAESVTMKRLAEQVPRHQSAVVALTGECTSSTEKLIPASWSHWPQRLKLSVPVNAYERSARARAECIAIHGLACSVCGMLFEDRYGLWGKGFIHVHHLTPLSSLLDGYEVDPRTELVPVCPN